MPAGKKSSGGCENVTFTVHLRIFVLENKIGEFGACMCSSNLGHEKGSLRNYIGGILNTAIGDFNHHIVLFKSPPCVLYTTETLSPNDRIWAKIG